MKTARLDILTFHRIMPEKEKYFIPPMAMKQKTFQTLLEKLALAGKFISLDRGVKQLKDKTLKGKKVALSFDDGYKDNFTLVRDILVRTGVNATFFIPVKPIDSQTPYWWDHLHDVFTRHRQSFYKWALELPVPLVLSQALRNLQQDTPEPKDMQCRTLVQALNQCTETERATFISKLSKEFGPCQNKQLLMSWDDIKQLHKDGFTIGSHSISHIPLTDLDEQAAHKEIADSAHLLENRTGARPTGFCYPRGAFTPLHARMVKSNNYQYAVTTQFGRNTHLDDVFTLKRRNMSDFQDIRARFPVAMHLLELSGRLDNLLAARRTG